MVGVDGVDIAAMVGWYSPPNLRGTLDLVWGCAFTIFICTWTANHVNVPPYGSSASWRFWYKVQIMLLSLLSPEYTAAVAALDLRSAVVLTKRMRDLGYDQWTSKHSFFALMGGYMIECDKRWRPLDVDTFLEWLENGHLRLTKPEESSKKKTKLASKAKTTRVKTSSTKQDGSTVVGEKSVSVDSVVSPNEAITLPWITVIDIEDRAKADWMLKAIASVQLIWLIVQCIGRAVQGLSLSALEATTIAYVACALFAYAAWWNKPYDLQSPAVVSIPAQHPLASRMKDMASYIGFDEEPTMSFSDRVYVIYVIGTFTILGSYSGLHLLAWGVHFGSTLEQQLWRWLTVSLLAIHIPLCTASLLMQTRAGCVTVKKACVASWQSLAEILLKPITPKLMRPLMRKLHVLDCLDPEALPPWPARPLILVLTLQYVFTSTYLMAESFVGLRRMPMLLYITVNWVKVLPHIR